MGAAAKTGCLHQQEQGEKDAEGDGIAEGVTFPRAKAASDRQSHRDVPDTGWYADITFIDTTDCGNCPFIEVEDSCTMEILSWNFLLSCGALEAFYVVDTAVMSGFDSGREDGFRLKTDGGRQFISTEYREGCSLLGIKLEAIRKRRQNNERENIRDNPSPPLWTPHLKCKEQM